MPNIKSAKKKMRQDVKKMKRNSGYSHTIAKTIKKIVRLKDEKSKGEEIRKAYSSIDKAVKKRVIHKNKAARLKAKVMKLSRSKK